jgi:DNA-binding transcriptional LysR family regulator
MDVLSSLSVFVRVAETRSFSRAADALGLSRPTVTRTVHDLEKELGVRLFYRTTRSVTLTAEGVSLLERANDLLARVQNIFSDVGDKSGARLTGHIRIAASAIIAWIFLQGVVGTFLRAHPGVSLELVTADREVRILEEGIDLAFKVGRSCPDTVIARKIGSVRNILCAAPSYFHRRRVPLEPEELESEQILVNTYLGSRFTFRSRSGERAAVDLKGRFSSGSSALLFNACLNGIGITMLPYEFAEPYIEQGALLRVLPDWEADEFGLFALYSSRQLSRAARAFLREAEAALDTVGGHVYDLRVRADPIRAFSRAEVLRGREPNEGGPNR